jgi:hypothetical protein
MNSDKFCDGFAQSYGNTWEAFNTSLVEGEGSFT